MRSYWVYMLRCNDCSFYVGMTNALHKRVFDHEQGLIPSCYTFRRRPVELVYSTEFNDVYEAISWEKHIKRWSHAKKEALITEDEQRLSLLSESAHAKKNSAHSHDGSSGSP